MIVRSNFNNIWSGEVISERERDREGEEELGVSMREIPST
jgi:hypothetical protein